MASTQKKTANTKKQTTGKKPNGTRKKPPAYVPDLMARGIGAAVCLFLAVLGGGPAAASAGKAGYPAALVPGPAAGGGRCVPPCAALAPAAFPGD